MTGRCRERAMMTTYVFRYTSECTIRSQIFRIFFASGGKGALTPLTKILRTYLLTLPTFHNGDRENSN